MPAQIKNKMKTELNVQEDVYNSKIREIVWTIVKNNRQIKDRTSTLEDLGLDTEEIACGPGGVGSIKFRRNGDVLFQYGCGHGKYNYARVVKIGHIRETATGAQYFLSEI